MVLMEPLRVRSMNTFYTMDFEHIGGIIGTKSLYSMQSAKESMIFLTPRSELCEYHPSFIMFASL